MRLPAPPFQRLYLTTLHNDSKEQSLLSFPFSKQLFQPKWLFQTGAIYAPFPRCCRQRCSPRSLDKVSVSFSFLSCSGYSSCPYTRKFSSNQSDGRKSFYDSTYNSSVNKEGGDRVRRRTRAAHQNSVSCHDSLEDFCSSNSRTLSSFSACVHAEKSHRSNKNLFKDSQWRSASCTETSAAAQYDLVGPSSLASSTPVAEKGLIPENSFDSSEDATPAAPRVDACSSSSVQTREKLWPFCCGQTSQQRASFAADSCEPGASDCTTAAAAVSSSTTTGSAKTAEEEALRKRAFTAAALVETEREKLTGLNSRGRGDEGSLPVAAVCAVLLAPLLLCDNKHSSSSPAEEKVWFSKLSGVFNGSKTEHFKSGSNNSRSSSSLIPSQRRPAHCSAAASANVPNKSSAGNNSSAGNKSSAGNNSSANNNSSAGNKSSAYNKSSISTASVQQGTPLSTRTCEAAADEETAATEAAESEGLAAAASSKKDPLLLNAANAAAETETTAAAAATEAREAVAAAVASAKAVKEAAAEALETVAAAALASAAASEAEESAQKTTAAATAAVSPSLAATAAPSAAALYQELSADSALQLFSGTAHPELAREVAAHLNISLGRVQLGRFADGECLVRILDEVRGKDVFVIQSAPAAGGDLHSSILELLLLISTLRRSSAKRITAVVPYLPYDRETELKGQRDDICTPIAAADLAILLQVCGADAAVFVDVHNPRIEGFFSLPGERALPMCNIQPHGIAARYFRKKGLVNPVIVATDNTAGEKAMAMWTLMKNRGVKAGFTTMVCDAPKRQVREGAPLLPFSFSTAAATASFLKHKSGSKSSSSAAEKQKSSSPSSFKDSAPPSVVEMQQQGTSNQGQDQEESYNLVGDVVGRDCIIVDDILDTAEKAEATARELRACGARRIFMFASHGVLSKGAVDRINKSPIEEVLVTNTVPIPPHICCEKLVVLSVGKVLAEAIRRLHEEQSVLALCSNEKDYSKGFQQQQTPVNSQQ